MENLELSDIDWNDLDLDEVKEVLAAYAIELHRAKKDLASAREAIARHGQWTSKRKAEAGYSENTSFDTVWSETLNLAKQFKALPTPPQPKAT